MTSVQYIQVHLDRPKLFLEDKHVSPFQMELRCLGNFRNLQIVDFYLGEAFILDELNEEDEEVPDFFQYYKRKSHIFLQGLWRFCGWCHPSRACSCCQLPEVRFHFRQPGSDTWEAFTLPFEKNEMELDFEEAALEERFKRKSHREVLKHWLKHWVGMYKSSSVFK